MIYSALSDCSADWPSVSSQFAVWAVERIFDIGAFTVLMVISIFMPSAMPSIPNGDEYVARFREAGFLLIGVVTLMAILAWLAASRGEEIANWFENAFRIGRPT